METQQAPPRRKMGRPRRGRTVKACTVMLPPFLHDWAMQQPEGFSVLVRQLLLQAKQQREELEPA